MAFNYSPKIVTDGLVLCLDASNPRSYASGSTAWLDLSRSENNGTLINGPTFSSANGGSIVFDGTNDYGEIPFETILNDCSFEFWFRATSVRAYQYMLSLRNNSVTNTFALYFDLNDTDEAGANQTMWVYWNSGGANKSTIPKTGTYGDWNDSTWRHYVFTRSTTVAPNTLHYMNGNLVTSVTRAGTQTIQFGNGSGYKLYIAQLGSNLYHFPGQQSVIKIYNRVLSAQEIQQNYNALKGRYGL